MSQAVKENMPDYYDTVIKDEVEEKQKKTKGDESVVFVFGDLPQEIDIIDEHQNENSEVPTDQEQN